MQLIKTLLRWIMEEINTYKYFVSYTDNVKIDNDFIETKKE